MVYLQKFHSEFHLVKFENRYGKIAVFSDLFAVEIQHLNKQNQIHKTN